MRDYDTTEFIHGLRNIKCFLFDMDGTINLGNELIPGIPAGIIRITYER